MSSDAKVQKYTDEQHAQYKALKPVMEHLYPWVFNARRPLPIHPDVLQKLIDDPYLSQSDEELTAFITIWQMRREYTHAVCMHQKYYDERGRVLCAIPSEIISDRAFALARFTQRANFNLYKIDPSKIK